MNWKIVLYVCRRDDGGGGGDATICTIPSQSFRYFEIGNQHMECMKGIDQPWAVDPIKGVYVVLLLE